MRAAAKALEEAYFAISQADILARHLGIPIGEATTRLLRAGRMGKSENAQAQDRAKGARKRRSP